ncbi:MAG TPA: glycosyltransferase family 2 protein, partial [Terriglobales bacterium]
NAEFIPELIDALSTVQATIGQHFAASLEVVFVVDGSPDNSAAVLEALLPAAPFRSQLLLHARNFGSFAAIRSGLRAATGRYFGMIAADLQEPPELLVAFLEKLLGDSADVVVGVRESRDDPAMTQMSAKLFWKFYKRIVIRDIPEGGVDLFACNVQVRDELLKLNEAHSSLVALVYWLGFRRSEVIYSRKARKYGRSAWTFRKKFDYLLDSIFAFTDLPIRLLTVAGMAGIIFASVFGLIVLIARLVGDIEVSGYATTMLTIIFFGALNTLGIGLVGHYAWRTYENTKHRPIGIVRSARAFDPAKTTSTEALKGQD